MTKLILQKKLNQYRKWSFGTLNIRTGKENDDGAKMYSVAKEMSKTDLQFLLLQEVRWKGVGSKSVKSISESTHLLLSKLESYSNPMALY